LNSPDRLFETDDTDLYERAPCAHLSTLPDGTIIRANQTFVEWIGGRAEQLVGHTRFQALLTIGSRIYYETHYAPLLQMQGFVNEIALEMRRTDGVVRPIVASARQLRDRDGTALLNRVALFDSTDRRRYEQELLEARKRAEKAARQLAQADAQKNEFIAMLVHELRNPLAPIRNALELMRRSGNEEHVVSKASGVMHRQVAHLVRLVEDLFDISRAGQSKLSIRRVPVDLASIIHHAVESSGPLLESAGLRFSLTLPDVRVYVEGDAARLAQAIGNLLNNASKFTPRGGSVTLTLEREGDGVAVIRIRDTGIGIEPAQLARIFEIFVQADGPLENQGGLGIGLTLARTLVEQHDGQLTVTSEGPGRGTEFAIRLPVIAAAPASVTRSFQPAAPEARPEARRVMVVDDNRDSADMMAMLLELCGHEVAVAHDGEKAVSLVEQFSPDVVFLDIGLPSLNGYEVATRIRSLQIPQPVLIALTGWGQADDRRRSAAAGFDHHVVKPIDHDMLMGLVAGVPSHSGR
jgi:PAS domain S-box-containing protein